ncbi:MAG: BatD family protein [Sedimentisphaerales bacterium]|nr:BatD family protein [Sedimentisphaerales bacterium]
MNRLFTYTFWSVLLTLSAAAGSPAAVRVYAKVDADTAIFPGDQFVYSIVVEGGSRPDKIDISPLAAFNPRSAGSGTSMQTVNDRTTISYSENYAITASKAGKISLPGVTVTVDGRPHTTNPVEVTISQPGTTDRISVEFTTSETRCYVGEPIVMTVKWIITARVEGGAFDVPVFQSEDFYIEDLSDPVAAQTSQQVAIHGVPVTITADRQSVKGMDAQIISFSKILIPKRAGHIRLDPVTVSTNMAVGRVRTGDWFNPIQTKYSRVSVQSDPVELEVLSLPEVGKPPQFYGLVGQYTISASATPTKVNVGDPITLTIRIGGNPYLKPVQWPQLEQIPELADNFKIPTEKASPIVENGTKVFTQTIRANNDRVAQIPSIPLGYFDPQKGRYAVARTDPIKLEVAPTKVLTNADVQGTGFAPVNREVEAIRKGLSANYYGPEVLVDQGLSPLAVIVSPAYMALWSIPLIGFIASTAARVAMRTSPESIARKRGRQARSAAVGQLRRVVSADPKVRHELLASAMRSYIGDRFDRVAASLTADDCYHIVAESTGDTQAAAQYKEIVAACEASRYASVGGDIGTDNVTQAIQLIGQVEKKSGK